MHEKRADALESGEKYYFTGKKCKRGHLARRLTMTGACCDCLKERRETERADFRALLASKEAGDE